MSTNDHTVPQSYLRRFAEERRGRGHFIVAVRADAPAEMFETNVRNIASVKGFYWATLDDGTDTHEVEHLFGRVEARSTPAFAAMLDDHHFALSQRWPLPNHLRERLAWWMAAQLLRTTRQRKRLAHMLEATPGLEPPRPIRNAAARHVHIAFIASQLGRLAHLVYQRPWGLGFSDACLTTCDVPVVILNNHDAEDQVLAAAVCDILLPLDPHRFLFLPGVTLLEDPRKRVDHRLKFDGGLGIALSEIIRDAADQHLLHHPRHRPPWLHDTRDIRPRLARAWEGEDPEMSPQYSVSYNVLPPQYGVERRWLTEHPPRPESSPTA